MSISFITLIPVSADCEGHLKHEFRIYFVFEGVRADVFNWFCLRSVLNIVFFNHEFLLSCFLIFYRFFTPAAVSLVWHPTSHSKKRSRKWCERVKCCFNWHYSENIQRKSRSLCATVYRLPRTDQETRKCLFLGNVIKTRNPRRAPISWRRMINLHLPWRTDMS